MFAKLNILQIETKSEMEETKICQYLPDFIAIFLNFKFLLHGL